MLKWIRRIFFCIVLVFLFGGGTLIADLTQLSGVGRTDAAEADGLKQQICDRAEEYAEKAKVFAIDTLTLLDQVIDQVLQTVQNDAEQENILSDG